MNRYHIKTGFNPQDVDRLKALTEQLNGLKWAYSEHCIDNLSYRVVDIEAVLKFIKDIKLSFEQIFEYYSDRDIIKICYRIKYSKLQDIILILTPDKKIITIYINSVEDNHITLKKELYRKGLING